MIVLIDHIQPISIPDEFLEARKNEVRALKTYYQGLHSLYMQISSIEQQLRSEIPPGRLESVFGRDARLAAFNVPLIECIFSWFAITACNYVRLVGWLAREHDSNQVTPRGYMDNVIPNVTSWRNKVGAHPVLACNSVQDSEAERLMSILPQITRETSTLMAGNWTLTSTSNGEVNNSAAIGSWSLTSVFLEMQDRYWPKKTDECR